MSKSWANQCLSPRPTNAATAAVATFGPNSAPISTKIGLLAPLALLWLRYSGPIVATFSLCFAGGTPAPCWRSATPHRQFSMYRVNVGPDLHHLVFFWRHVLVPSPPFSFHTRRDVRACGKSQVKLEHITMRRYVSHVFVQMLCIISASLQNYVGPAQFAPTQVRHP